MKIKQCYIPPHMRKRFSYFFKKYSLKEYQNPKLPAVFFSLWKYGVLKSHKGFALVIWRGSDILKFGKKISTLKKNKNIYHVAISKYIAKDLEKYKIKYKLIPIVGVNMKYFTSYELGNEIYSYVPSHNPAKYNIRYGMNTIKQIQKKCKYKINITTSISQFKRKKMVDIYKKCFCGLRMTTHDGLPSQVIEMGLMGRKSFYNGDIPGSIRWDKKNIDKIIEDIERESEKIGSRNDRCSEEIFNFINIHKNWLNTDFWR